MLSGQRCHVRSDSGPRLLHRNANGDLQERQGRKARLRQRGKVNALIKLKTNRVVARQPGKAGRPVAAVRASFAERTERARMPNPVSLSKGSRKEQSHEPAWWLRIRRSANWHVGNFRQDDHRSRHCPFRRGVGRQQCLAHQRRIRGNDHLRDPYRPRHAFGKRDLRSNRQQAARSRQHLPIAKPALQGARARRRYRSCRRRGHGAPISSDPACC